MALSGDAAACPNAAAEDGNCTRISCMAPPQLSASQYIKLRKSSEAGLFVLSTCGVCPGPRAAFCRLFDEDAALVRRIEFMLFPAATECGVCGCANSIFTFEVSGLVSSLLAECRRRAAARASTAAAAVVQQATANLRVLEPTSSVSPVICRR